MFVLIMRNRFKGKARACFKLRHFHNQPGLIVPTAKWVIHPIFQLAVFCFTNDSAVAGPSKASAVCETAEREKAQGNELWQGAFGPSCSGLVHVCNVIIPTIILPNSWP